MAGEGRVPWRRLLGSLLGALLVAMAGFIALWADVEEPRPIHIAIEIIALPFVRLVYLIGGMRGTQAICFAALSSILVWWAIFCPSDSKGAWARCAPACLTRGCSGLAFGASPGTARG